MGEDPIQGVFDFETGNPDGLANWRNQREALLRAVREEWSLPVGRRVRIRLRNIDGEFVGTLDLVRDPPAIDRRLPLALRVGRVDVAVAEIEQCIAVGP